MLNFALVAGPLILSTMFAASQNTTATHDVAALDATLAVFAQSAADTCRDELADDMFASFRLEGCVVDKIGAAIDASGEPALADRAAARRGVVSAALGQR